MTKRHTALLHQLQQLRTESARLQSCQQRRTRGSKGQCLKVQVQDGVCTVLTFFCSAAQVLN